MALNLPFLKKKKKKEKEEEKRTQVPEVSAGKKLAKGMVSVQDIIAPPAIEVDFDCVRGLA